MHFDRTATPGGGECPRTKPCATGYETLTVMVTPIETEPTLIVGNPVPLFDGPYRHIELNSPRPYDIASDGQRFLMLKEIVDADVRDEAAIILVQNWIEELKTLFPTSR